METIALDNLIFTTLTDEILAGESRFHPEAFAELYRRHFQAVYRYQLGRTGNTFEAEDLTTVTFVAALEGIQKFRGSGTFLSWLFGIARRQQLMNYRSLKREVNLENAYSAEDPSPSPEVLAGHHFQLDQVRKCLVKLSGDRREAILLCVFADLSAEESAEIIGKSPEAIKMLLLRGLRDIRNLLKD